MRQGRGCPHAYRRGAGGEPGIESGTGHTVSSAFSLRSGTDRQLRDPSCYERTAIVASLPQPNPVPGMPRASWSARAALLERADAGAGVLGREASAHYVEQGDPLLPVPREAEPERPEVRQHVQ